MDMVVPSVNGDLTLERLVQELRQRLSTGVKLPAERKLGEELQVKRHTLRKALAVLRHSGELSVPRPRGQAALMRGGAALARDTNPLEVIELRLVLEPALARLAALRATPGDIARIEKAAICLNDMENAGADLLFHKLVAMATHNALAADLYLLLRRIGADSRLHVRNVQPRPANRLRQRDMEHSAIAQAIALRDPEAAERAMRAHLQMVHREILDRISPNPSAQLNS